MSEEVRRVLVEHCKGKGPEEHVFINPETGISSIKTSERYVHPSTERKRAAVEQIMTLHRQTCPNPAPQEERRPLLAAVNS
ncbi:MAG TPA: hypothetical protein VIW80_13445 [Pyrinomonadaceae bacterium]|jgi:hypothetical protein